MKTNPILLGAGILSFSIASMGFAPAFAGDHASAAPGTARPAQARPDPTALIAAQKNALAPLAFMDGEWRGTAVTVLPDGSKHSVTQTERIGAFLDGSVKVIEGRGHEANGRISFNALGIVYFDSTRNALRFQAHAMGMSGDYSFVPTSNGYVWEIPAGPMTIRYTATIQGGEWHEVGDRVMPGQPEQRFFEMNLKRIGDSSWPSAGAVASK
jgi:hypothetical protein